MGVLGEFAPADHFIETGLGCGQSCRAALAQPFKRLHTIEIDPTLIERFGPVDPRLTIHLGSSPDILPGLCDPKVSTMFWLDAHYSAGQYTSDSSVDQSRLDPRYGQCPLLAELAIIKAVEWEVWPWIYIDDAVCFEDAVYHDMWAQYDRAQYPTRAEIEAALPEGYTLDIFDTLGLAYRALHTSHRRGR